MTAIITETPSVDREARAFQLVGSGPHPELIASVFVSIPCTHSEVHEHVLRFDRDDFVRMIKHELNLVEAESGSFSLTDDDLALLGWS